MAKNPEQGTHNEEIKEHEDARKIYGEKLQKGLSIHGITPNIREAIENPALDLAGIRRRHVVGLVFESPVDSSDIPLSPEIVEFLLSQGKEELSIGGIKNAHLGFGVAYVEMRSESRLNMWSFDLKRQWTSRDEPGRYVTPPHVVRSLAEIAEIIGHRPSESHAVSTRVTDLDYPDHSLSGGSIVSHYKH